jgi:peptide/nickel transport system substrate-binding protein
VLSPHRRFLVVFVVVAAAGVCAPGCARREEPPATVSMRIGIGAPPKGSSGSGINHVITSLESEPWLTSRPDGRQSERVVSDWTWNDDGTVLRLKLRPDVFFHDGTKLTPELAVQIMRGSIDRREALSLATISSVKVSGHDSIELSLSEPNAFLVPDLSLSTVRLPGAVRIGAGPFRVVKRDAQQTIMAAFPQYYRGRPALSEIAITNYPTQRNAWTALMRGEIDMLHEVSRDAAEFVDAATTVNTYKFPRPYYIPLVFNVRHPILKSIEVRKAINEALDKVTLVRNGLNQRGRPADGPIWPEHWALSTPTAPFVFDPAAANHRLDAAGFRSRPSVDGRLPGRFSFTCLVFASDPRFERLAVLVQRQLADVGIDMKLLPVKQDELEQRLSSGAFDAFLFEMFGRSLSFLDEFWHSHEGGRLNTGYRSADAALDRMRRARSEDEVRATVAEFARILHDDPPAAFLAWQETTRAVSTKFDVSPETNRDIFTNVWQWRPADVGKQASR